MCVTSCYIGSAIYRRSWCTSIPPSRQVTSSTVFPAIPTTAWTSTLTDTRLRLVLASALLIPLSASAQTASPHAIEVPAWFSETFLDLREDVREAATEGKRLMIYLGQDGCPYCRALMQT